MTDSQRLLADYANNSSEAAFRELVTRYLDLVYSTAIRLLGGDTHLAEDVAQSVFVDLAHLARSLSSDVRLGGWLHRHTCFMAAKTLRSERRRQSRERQAVEMNALPDHSKTRLTEVAPILDEAINQLGAADRAAVLLRFYERLDFRSVGEALGTNEAAAQKRVSRALEKLHGLLKRRGITFSIAVLGTALTCEAVTAAPVGSAASISGIALARAAAGAGTTLTFLKLVAATKFKAGFIAAIVVVSAVTPLLVQHKAQAALREQGEASRQRSSQLAQLTADNQHLAGLLAQTKGSQPLPDSQMSELMRLRGEVGLLRDHVQKMRTERASASPSSSDQIASLKQMYAARVDRLKQWLDANPSEKIPELQNIPEQTWLVAVETLATDDDFARAASNLRANAEGHVFDTLFSALRKYGRDNNGQFPTSLSQLNPYFSSPIDDAILERYEILLASNLIRELQPGGDWVITQKAAANPALDSRMAYGLTNMLWADERVTNRWTLVH